MPRLIDRILSNGYYYGSTESEVLYFPDSVLPEVFLINNVADYFYAQVDRSKTVWEVDEFPNVALPYKQTWMEYDATGIRCIDKNQLGVDSIGVLFQCETTQNMDSPSSPLSDLMPQTSGKLNPAKPNETIEFSWGDSLCKVPKSEFHWHATAKVFLSSPDNKRPVLCLTVVLLISYDGKLVSFGKHDPTGKTPDFLARLHGGADHKYEGEADARRTIFAITHAGIYPAFLALTFLHCKNVQLIDNAPNPKMARAYQRRKGIAPVTFKTLEVQSVQRRLREAGATGGADGLKLALHKCRGHFNHYGEKWLHPDGRPKGKLFGKHEGMFWIPETAKGRSTHGAVIKDYNVREPKE